MFGSGVLKGLGVTLKEFIGTYVDDVKRIPSRYAGGREELSQSEPGSAQTGLFTIQYPEERRKLPERFRYIPMLIRDAETGEDRCTACGICAKVCPPQCIWIVREKDEQGKPVTQPAEFHIDTTICMNCGLCAEFCPFDAIKMNHDYEIAAYERMPHLVFNLEELTVLTTYYAKIRPTAWQAEEEARAAAEAEKAAKAAERAAAKAAKDAAAAPKDKPVPAKRTPEETEKLKAEAAARRAAKAEGDEGVAEVKPAVAAENKPAVAAENKPAAAAENKPAVAAENKPAPAKRTPEEIEQLKAEAAARRAAKAAQEGGEN